MKKILFMGVIGLFLLGSCNSKSGEGHNHETEEHAHAGHDHEGHDHENEGSGHHHDDGHHHGEKTVAAHSDEIILPPAKAQAAGVAVSTIEPGVFNQVIKTSGQVMAAQGDESVAVATVAGVVSFHGKSHRGHECRQRYSPRDAFVQEYGGRRPRTKSAHRLRNSPKRV